MEDRRRMPWIAIWILVLSAVFIVYIEWGYGGIDEYFTDQRLEKYERMQDWATETRNDVVLLVKQGEGDDYLMRVESVDFNHQRNAQLNGVLFVPSTSVAVFNYAELNGSEIAIHWYGPKGYSEVIRTTELFPLAGNPLREWTLKYRVRVGEVRRVEAHSPEELEQMYLGPEEPEIKFPTTSS